MESARCRAFVAAAETGSFSEAAKKLNYTPSGVSQLVTALEQDLGFSLLIRSRKGVKLTSDGVRMMPPVREFLMQEDRIYQTAGELKGVLAGTINVASYSSVAAHWLAAVIKKFQEDHPQVRINLIEGIHQEVWASLQENRAEIAFISYKDGMNCHWIPLQEDRMIAMLPVDHPCAGLEAYPLQRCGQEDFIMPALGEDSDVMELLHRFEITPDIKFSTVENFSTMSMIEQGLGMSIMNELITESWQCNVAMLPLDPPQSITLGIAVPSLENVSPAAREFIRYAEKMLKR